MINSVSLNLPDMKCNQIQCENGNTAIKTDYITMPNKHHSRSTGHIILIQKDQRCRICLVDDERDNHYYTAGIIKITWLGLSKGGQMSLHVEQQEYSYIYTSMQTNVQTNKFINVCLLIREVEDFSVCLWVVYLYVILPVNDAVIGFLRTLCLYLCIIHCTLMDRINRNGRHVFVPFKFLLNCNDL